MTARTINDVMWHWVDEHRGHKYLMTVVANDVCVSIRIPPVLEYQDDVWVWIERIQGAIWGIVGQHGVYPRDRGVGP